MSYFKTKSMDSFKLFLPIAVAVFVPIVLTLAGCGGKEVKAEPTKKRAIKEHDVISKADVKKIIQLNQKNDPILSLALYLNTKEYIAKKSFYNKKDLLPPKYLELSLNTALIKWQKLLIYEIYAHQGYVFKDPILKKIFETCDWYERKQKDFEIMRRRVTWKENRNIEYLEKYMGIGENPLFKKLPPAVKVKFLADGNNQFSKMARITNSGGNVVTYRVVSFSMSEIVKMNPQEEYNKSVGVSQKEIVENMKKVIEKRIEAEKKELTSESGKYSYLDKYKKDLWGLWDKYKDADLWKINDNEMTKLLEVVNSHSGATIRMASGGYEIITEIPSIRTLQEFFLYISYTKKKYEELESRGKNLINIKNNKIGYKMQEYGPFKTSDYFRAISRKSSSADASMEGFLTLFVISVPNEGIEYIRFVDTSGDAWKKINANNDMKNSFGEINLTTGKITKRTLKNFLTISTQEYAKNNKLSTGNFENISTKIDVKIKKNVKWLNEARYEAKSIELIISNIQNGEILFHIDYNDLYNYWKEYYRRSTFLYSPFKIQYIKGDIWLVKMVGNKLSLIRFYLPEEKKKIYFDKMQ